MYRVLRMGPFAPFFHIRVVYIHQGLSRNAPSGAPKWAWPAHALILLLEQDAPDLLVEWNALAPRQLLQVCGEVDDPTRGKGDRHHHRLWSMNGSISFFSRLNHISLKSVPSTYSKRMHSVPASFSYRKHVDFRNR